MKTIGIIIVALLGVLVWAVGVAILLSITALTVYGGFEFGRNVLGWW